MARLSFVVHAEMRADHHRPLDRPVVVGHTDTAQVAVLLDPEHADLLARVLARYSRVREDLDVELDPATWDHALVDLLACRALAAFAADAPALRAVTA